MYIFRFRLTVNGNDDSFYFKNPPNEEDIVLAIDKHRNLAGGDWHFLYDEFLRMVNQIEAKDWANAPKMTGSKCGTGGRAGNGSYSFDRFPVIEN